MPISPYHQQQLAANFQVELNRLLSKEIDWTEDVLVTVVSVATSIDGQHINVVITVLPKIHQEEVLQKLRHHAKGLAFQLGKLLGMRRTPELRFKLGEDIIIPGDT